MTVPVFQDFMLPILKLFGDNYPHTTSECIAKVIEHFNISESDLKMRVPSGKQTLVSNRVYWSLTYLKKSILIKTIRRGEYQITERGIDLLSQSPLKIDKKVLSNYNEYLIFSNSRNEKNEQSVNTADITSITPEEEIGKLFDVFNSQLADEILEVLMSIDPYTFESIVLDLLYKMGYGINEDSINLTRKSNDEGIDGVINQDKLGLDKVYVQAKRWNNNNRVGRKEVQEFAGALAGQNSSKGIFITTGEFNNNAIDYSKKANLTIVLINGRDLAKYMISYNVGVQLKTSYEFKKIDNDYFDSF